MSRLPLKLFDQKSLHTKPQEIKQEVSNIKYILFVCQTGFNFDGHDDKLQQMFRLPHSISFPPQRTKKFPPSFFRVNTPTEPAIHFTVLRGGVNQIIKTYKSGSAPGVGPRIDGNVPRHATTW